MAKVATHKWWILTVLLTAPVVVRAAVPHNFMAGPISAMQVNDNFANLDTRLTALSTTVANLSTHPTVTDSLAGPSVVVVTAGGQQTGTMPGCQESPAKDFFDCVCPPGFLPISGGAFAGGNNNPINASFAGLAAGASPNTWRIACGNANANERVQCQLPFAVCLKVQGR